MAAINPSPEVKAILKQTHDLTIALSNNSLGVAGILLGKELISSEVYSKVLVPTFTSTEKAAIMIESTRKIVEITPEKFTEFVEALSGQVCAKEVMESLCTTYQSELTLLTYDQGKLVNISIDREDGAIPDPSSL